MDISPEMIRWGGIYLCAVFISVVVYCFMRAVIDKRPIACLFWGILMVQWITNLYFFIIGAPK